MYVSTPSSSSALSASIPAGVVLGERYLLQQPLASDSTPRDAYLALDLRSDRRPCFLRELPPFSHSHSLHRGIQTRIRQEWKALSTLPQVRPYLVRSILHDGERTFLVQDAGPLQTAAPLSHTVGSLSSPWTEQQVLQLFSGILGMLQTLHQRQVHYQALHLEGILLPAASRYGDSNPSVNVGQPGKFALDLGYKQRWLTAGRGTIRGDLYHLAIVGLILLSPSPVSPAELTSPRDHQKVLAGVGDRLQALLTAMLSTQFASAIEVQQQVEVLLGQASHPFQHPAPPAGQLVSQGNDRLKPSPVSLLREQYPQLAAVHRNRGFSTLLPRSMRGYLTPLSISTTLMVSLARVLSQSAPVPPETTVWVSGTPVPHSEVSTLLSHTQSSKAPQDSHPPSYLDPTNTN